MTETCYAILIGNSQYPKEPELPDLRCPEQDVDDLHAVLTSSTHGLFAQQSLSLKK